jgi:superfamily II DNA or RNA helicase
MANFHNIQDHLRSVSCQKARGNKFEKYCKWFLENDPYYKQKFTKIWLWKNWPERWGSDKGIDLIAQTTHGEIWAIQSKAYDESYYITKEDIDSFLSESSRSIITHRLLIATTNKIGPNATEVLKGQEKSVVCILLDKLENADLDWSLALENKESIELPPKQPHQHQKDALTAILKRFQASNQGQIRMACGTGKSLIGLWLAQKLDSQYTLVLVPSLSLISQLYKAWATNCGIFKFNPIFVCSDHTVADEEDMSTVEFGYPVTTSAQELIKIFKENNILPTVVFATYQSSVVLKDACILNPELTFDLAIADEAHRCAGKSNSEFSIITHKNSIRTKRKLYMTATPKIYSENVKNKTEEHGIEIASMDDEYKFGPVFYQLLFSQAINQKLLSDYHVYISVVNHTTYKEYAEKGRFVRFDDFETDARTLATQIYTAKTIKKLGLRKIITFHNSVKAANDFIKSFKNALILLPAHEQPNLQFCDVITGDLPQAERNKILHKFAATEKQGVSILANVKCLSEGVDVPAIDGIVFVDAKGSEIDIVQSVGRVMRTAENKRIGTILIPVFVDTDSDHEIDLENSCFKKVWQVVKALRSHDDLLAEELDNIRLELGKRTYKAPPKLTKITIDIPVTIEKSFAQSVSYKLIEKCSPLSLALSHPEIAAQWHPSKNGTLTPSNVTRGVNKKIWWICDKGIDHEWKSTVSNRTSGFSCPICTNQLAVKSNCLATTHPDLVTEWHPSKNGNLTPHDIVAGSGKKIWWQCSIADDHEWKTAIEKRTKEKTKCPMCRGFIAVLSNCLSTTYPAIAAQWHATKNENLTPYDVVAGSDKKIWWQCNKNINHIWLATAHHRAKSNTGCSFCNGKQITKEECLGALYPEIAAQWHPTKNNTTPFDIHPGSNKRIWWKCPMAEDHEWKTAVYKRIPNSKCPMCVNRISVKSNCFATTHSEIAAQWHPIKNGYLTPYDVTAGSNKRVWWKCSVADDHEWKTTIQKRSNERTNCPHCYKKSRKKEDS